MEIMGTVHSLQSSKYDFLSISEYDGEVDRHCASFPAGLHKGYVIILLILSVCVRTEVWVLSCFHVEEI